MESEGPIRFSAASGRGLIEAKKRQEGRVQSEASFPRHRAAASLNPVEMLDQLALVRVFSAASGRGLIEAWMHWARYRFTAPVFSAASGRGLIEARNIRELAPKTVTEFSAASGRGLIEAMPPTRCQSAAPAFSAASGRGLIEASSAASSSSGVRGSFPRHRAAASLKPEIMARDYAL